MRPISRAEWLAQPIMIWLAASAQWREQQGWYRVRTSLSSLGDERLF